MSIREDARNDRMLRDILGYDPRAEIERLKQENAELKARIERMRKFKQQ